MTQSMLHQLHGILYKIHKLYSAVFLNRQRRGIDSRNSYDVTKGKALVAYTLT